MTDNLASYGIRPRRPRWGDDFRIERRRVASGYSSAVAGTPDVNVFDPVVLQTDGTVIHAVAGATNMIYGIVMGFSPYWNGSVLFQDNRLPAGQGTYGTNLARQHFVYVLPAIGYEFEVDVDDGVTATTESAYKQFIGENVNLSYAAAAFNSGTGAFPRLAIAGHAVTNTFQFRIVDLAEEVNIDYSGLNVKLIVQVNLTDEAPVQPLGT